MTRSIAAAAAAILFLGTTATFAQTTGGNTLDAVSTRLADRYVCNTTDGGSSLTVASRTTGQRLATISAAEGGLFLMNATVTTGNELPAARRSTLASTLTFLNTSLPIGTLAFNRDGSLSLTHHVGLRYANADDITRVVIRMIDQALMKRAEILG